MTLAESSLEMHLAGIFCDYLSHADSHRAGVPDNQVLPKMVFDMAKEPPQPSLIVVAKEDGSKGARRTINLSFMHIAWTAVDDPAVATAPGQSTTEGVSTTIARVDERLRMMHSGEKEGSPLLGWRDWYAALPPSRRAGFVISGLRFHGAAPLHRSTENKRVLIAAVTLDVHVRIVPV